MFDKSIVGKVVRTPDLDFYGVVIALRDHYQTAVVLGAEPSDGAVPRIREFDVTRVLQGEEN